MKKEEHILVWRLSAMGDVAMLVPILKLLVKQYPDLKITVVSKPFFEPIFKNLQNINFVKADVKGNHKGVFGLYTFFKELKKLNCTYFADLHNVTRSKIIRFFFKTAKIPVAYIDKGRIEKKELTKQKLKTIKPLKSTHQRYADVFEKLGFPLKLSTLERIKKPLSNQLFSFLKDKNGSFIGIAPFAAFKGKMYPLNLMKEVIDELSKLNCTILLFGGGKEETELLKKISLEFKNTQNTSGKFSFSEELALISNLDVMISMDSGNAHLAAMFGVDVITIWGVTHPFAGFSAYNQSKDSHVLPNLKKYPLLPCSIYGNKVFKGYENVMNTISPKLIVDKVIKVMQKKEL